MNHRPFITLAALGVATASALLLSGCATLPTQGGVLSGPEIVGDANNDFLYFTPYDPPTDAGIGDILTGFLSAGTGPQNDYSVAREYLTNDLKSDWLPNKQVVVIDSVPEIKVDADTATAEVKVHTTALVDELGHLKLTHSKALQSYEFGFAKESGQWRVSATPDLTIISRQVFDVVFKPFSLYFFDSQRHYLVPDVRWFPSRASTATRLVGGLITGPDSWLGKAVVNPIPKGTKLAIDAVTISNGVASVDFNSKFLTASATVRGQIKAQILATLRQISGVNEVEIAVDRNIQDIAAYSPWDVPNLSFSPVVLTDLALARLSGNSLTDIESTVTPVQNLHPSDFAITTDSRSAAFLTSNGVYRLTLSGFGAEPFLVDARPKLLPPVFDRQGWLWSVNAGPNPSVALASPSNVLAELNLGALAKSSLTSFALSPEGARLAVSVATKEGQKVELFGVERDKNGQPIALSEQLVLRTANTRINSVSWLDETNLGLIIQMQNGWSQPSQLSVGGFEQTITGMSDLVQFVGNNATEARYALTKAGSLMHYRSSTWNVIQPNIKRIHFAN